MNGFLCVLKPPGMTSSDVVVRVRHKLGRGVKVGHAGTLDPEASGVLPLMIGRAARLFDYLVEKEKTYVALEEDFDARSQSLEYQALRAILS